MNCQLVQEHIVEHLLGETPQSDREAVEQHLSLGCSACQQELDRTRDAIGVVYDALPVGRLPAMQANDLANAVLERDQRIVDTQSVVLPSFQPFTLVDYFLFAASFAAGLIFVLTAAGPGFSNRPETPAVQAEALTDEEADQRTQIVLTSMQAHDDESINGVLMYDRFLRELHFFAPKMVKPPPGRQFFLKLVQGTKVRLTPIHIDTSGTGIATIEDASPASASSPSIELLPAASSSNSTGEIS